MIVFKCDQCNRSIEGRRSTMVLHTPIGDNDFAAARYDICPACTKKLGLLLQRPSPEPKKRRRSWIFKIGKKH